MSPDAPDPSLPARLREFHVRLPLAGDPPNAFLSLPDDRILYLAAILRNTPIPAPTLSPGEWKEFVALLRPHGVHALLAYRLSAWPEDGRPPKDVMDFLKRQHLIAAARAMRAGLQIQTAVDALEAAGVPSVLLKGPALRNGLPLHVGFVDRQRYDDDRRDEPRVPPQTDSDKPVKFVDLHLCESEDSSERTGLQLVVVRHDGSHPAAVRHL